MNESGRLVGFAGNGLTMKKEAATRLRFLMVQILAVLFILLVTAVIPAHADTRVALVIGNSAYENVARLINPAHDADAITAMFKQAGFDVVESRRNLKLAETRRVLRDFADKARDADIAVVYYAGHGVEVDGANYLIPVDAALERDTDVYDEALSLDRLLLTIEPAKKLRLVILDACRDNPFAKTMKRTIGSRAVGRGFAKVEPSSPNTLIAFAAKAGSTASDGDSKNSPFTAALVKHIATPGLDLRKAFGFIRDDVLKVTSNKQEPFVYGSLGGNDVSLVPAAPPSATSTLSGNSEVRRDYELAERVGNKQAWDVFISEHPSGFYTELAKAQRDKLAAELARIEATDNAKRAQEDKARLAAQNAQKKEQDDAAARAKAAEQARLAAEQLQRDQEAKLAAAEKAKSEAQVRLAEQERIAAAQRVKPEVVASPTAGLEALTAGKSSDSETAPEKQPGQIAALTPPSLPAPSSKAESLNRQLQTELRRVGCHVSSFSDDWGTAAKRSLEQFNKRSGLKLDVKTASVESLDALRGQTARVCPLVCKSGFRPEGELCVEIVCKAGFEVGDNNTCERIAAKRPKRVIVKRNEPSSGTPQPVSGPKQAATPQTNGQVFCNTGGCRQVPKGCRLVSSYRESDYIRCN